MTTPASPPVSVVTPFYNTATYLAECIRSVLVQTVSDFEYILVDNCSTDGSAEIAASFARQDARIRIIRTPRLLPQVENYNFALAQIGPRSRYTKIVQADDWLYPRCLEAMTEVADRSPRIGIVSSLYRKGEAVFGEGVPAGTTILPGRAAARLQLLEDRFFLGSPTTVMYRSDVVRARQPFFRLGRYHEDTEAGYEILRDHDFGFVHEPLSYLRVDTASQMGQRASFAPHLVDRLIIVESYGRDFLTAAEFEVAREEAWANLCELLGAAVLHRRESAFWRYQRRGLATAGLSIPWGRVAREAARQLAGALSRPREFAGALWRRTRGKLDGRPGSGRR